MVPKDWFSKVSVNYNNIWSESGASMILLTFKWYWSPTQKLQLLTKKVVVQAKKVQIDKFKK